LLTIAEADKADVERKIELKQKYDGSEEECEGTEDEEKEERMGEKDKERMGK
jgi:hypothetical protein